MQMSTVSQSSEENWNTPNKGTWFFSSLDMPDAALPEALEAGSLQTVGTSNISTPSEERSKNILAHQVKKDKNTLAQQ